MKRGLQWLRTFLGIATVLAVPALAQEPLSALQGSCLPKTPPTKVIHGGILDLKDHYNVSGFEVYTATETLVVAGDRAPWIVPGKKDPAGAGSVALKARYDVVLKPGFWAQAGSRVEVSILPIPRRSYSQILRSFPAGTDPQRQQDERLKKIASGATPLNVAR